MEENLSGLGENVLCTACGRFKRFCEQYPNACTAQAWAKHQGELLQEIIQELQKLRLTYESHIIRS